MLHFILRFSPQVEVNVGIALNSEGLYRVRLAAYLEFDQFEADILIELKPPFDVVGLVEQYPVFAKPKIVMSLLVAFPAESIEGSGEYDSLKRRQAFSFPEVLGLVALHIEWPV